jgi:serine/threonine-protein kinase
MAPEIALGSQEPDHRVDIYALGCVAYWLLTGTLVFGGDTAVRMLYEHTSKEPEPPSRRVDGIPASLETVILDCLAKDPEARPQSARELAARLESCGLPPWTQEQARACWARRATDAELASAPTVAG